MNDIQLVSADKIKTLEQYGSILLTGIINLQSLRSYHYQPYASGLFNEDEEETAKTICWEIDRLIKLYEKQFENINARAPIDQDTVISSLQSVMTKPKRKRKNDL